MADIDKTSPADDDVVSAFPSNERNSRAAIETIIGTNHSITNDTDQGKHKVIEVIDNEADPTIDTGDVGLWNNSGALKTRVGSGTAAVVLTGDSGTKILFPQASAPTGWTQDTTVNDRVIRVVDDSGTGGDTDGSWTISGVTVDSHTLTIAEIPAHTHTYVGTNFINAGTSTGGSAQNLQNKTTGSTGGGGGHTHGLTADGTWRPAYLDCIMCTKD